MPEPLKNCYNAAFFESFTATLSEFISPFNKQAFLNHVFDRMWADRELKQRTQHIAKALHAHLPGNYKKQVHTILRIIEHLETSGEKGSFAWIFFPEFIGLYGLNDLETSCKAMERITQFISCEFAVRPFLLKYPEAMYERMRQWSLHPHPHVRRFASEGCRPRLPWAPALPALKKDPRPVVPILENLKSDPSLFVRKSVANHLNDITRDHPQLVLQLAKKWKGSGPETDWIIRHGCRTLLKKADPGAYKLFDLHAAPVCRISQLQLENNRISLGDRLRFSFVLKTESKPTKLRLEYAIDYVKAGSKNSRKIFQLSEKTFHADSLFPFSRTQRFDDMTTRKHYPGKHRLTILVNGKEMAAQDFNLLSKKKSPAPAGPLQG